MYPLQHVQFLFSGYMSRSLCILLGCLLLGVTLTQSVNPHGADIDDNDFAEFEEFEEDGKSSRVTRSTLLKKIPVLRVEKVVIFKIGIYYSLGHSLNLGVAQDYYRSIWATEI